MISSLTGERAAQAVYRDSAREKHNREQQNRRRQRSQQYRYSPRTLKQLRRKIVHRWGPQNASITPSTTRAIVTTTTSNPMIAMN